MHTVSVFPGNLALFSIEQLCLIMQTSVFIHDSLTDGITNNLIEVGP